MAIQNIETPGPQVSAREPGEASGALLPPLVVSGLVVQKADLLAALRVYVPQLTDLTVLDATRFVLQLAPADSASGGSHAG
ncbi:MAG: hypothetical protein ACKVVP_20215 [Chloroflexota bacterium]